MSDVQMRLTLQDDVSSKLTKVSSTARTASTQLQQMGKALDQAFKGNGADQFASKLGRAVDTATTEVQGLGDAISDVVDSASGADFSGLSDVASGASNIADAAEQAGDSLGEAAEEADNLGDSINEIDGGNGLQEVGDNAEEAGESMSNAEGKAVSLGSALKTLFQIAAGAVVVKKAADIAKESIDLGRNYTSMISEVQAISGASEAEMATLEATARQYGATTVFSATEAAEALKYMSLAGWTAEQSTSALGGVLDLAAASGMGLGQASDMVTDYLSAFGMQASEAGYFADMLAFAQSNSNTTAEQLGQAYLNSAAIMHGYGQDVETTTAMLEAMANQGTKGSRAGTQMAAIMRDITNKMEDGAIQIGETSVAVTDAEGNFRDLTDIMRDVEKATDGMGSAQKAAALSETFTADSTKGINQILTEGVEKVAGYEEALRGAGGAAGEAAKIMNDNLNGDLANMNSAWEEMKLQIFEGMEQPLRSGVQYITANVIPAMTSLLPAAFEAIAGAVSKLGNALKPVFDLLTKNPKIVTTALAGIGTGLAVFKTASLAKNMISTADGAFKLTGVLGKLGGVITANPWIAGAAALAAGIVIVKNAVDAYNEMKVDESLESHFGNIELSQPDISELAGQIIGVDWVVNVNAALGEFENAEEFHEEAEQAIQDNEALLWKARVQTILNHADDGDPVNPFVEGIQTSLTGRESSSGLTFDPTVPITLEPDGEAATLAESLVSFANLVVSGASGEDIEEYAKQVAMQIDPDGDQATLSAALVTWANGVVSGASAEDLEDYTDNVLVDLTPEESDTFFSALTAVVQGMTETKLETPPKWEDTLTVELTPEMAEEFQSNIESFIEAKKQELSSLTTGSLESLETVLGQQAGSALISQVTSWAAEDTAELDSLSSSLTRMVQDALEDGVLDVEEQAAIDILQSKINNILSGWQQAQADAEWQTLQQKWSGKALTADSFTQLIEEAHNQRETAMEALYADSTQMNAVFNGWLNSGKINQTQRDQIDRLWTNNMWNMEGEAMGRSLTFASGTLQDAYGDLITENLGRINSMGGANTMNALNEMAASGAWDIDRAWSEFASSRDFVSKNGGADRKALNSMYESMKPDVKDMGDLIDSYKEEGMKVPSALMDAYNQAIEVGAASGDEEAGWAMYADSIMKSGNEQLKDALTNENNPMYETLRNQMPEELATAIDRAAYAAENSVESADLTEMFNAILGLDDPNATIDLARLSELCEKYGLDISEYIESKGIDVEANPEIKLADFSTDEVAASLKHIDGLEFDAVVDNGIQFTISGDTPTVWSIAEQLVTDPSNQEQVGEAAQKILDANGWSNADATQLVDGTEVVIPAELVVDQEKLESSAGEAANQVAEEAEELANASEPDVTMEGKVDGDYSAGKTSGAEEAGNQLNEAAKEEAESAEPEPADKEIPASITINLQSLDDTALSEGISNALAENENAIPVTVPADVTVSVGSVDSSALSTGIETALGGEDGAGSIPVGVTADVTITKGKDNSAQIYTEVGTALDTAFNTTYTPAGSADVTLTQTNNAEAIYSEVGNAVRSAFSRGYSASASVNVSLTANYSLANPTKTITFGGGATGSATVTATLHALGGIFDTPHLGMVAEDGPEAIIPLDGSENALSLWEQAGRALGLDRIQGQGSNLQANTTQGAGTPASGGGSSNRTVDININGNGTIRVSGGMNKESVVEVLMENMRDVFMNIVQQEIIEEGDGVYEF